MNGILNHINQQILGNTETHITTAQSTGAAENTDCISPEGLDPPNEYLGYDTKQSEGEAPVTLKLQGMRSTPSLPSLPGSF